MSISSADHLRNNHDQIESQELLARVRAGSLMPDAHAIALKVLTSRGESTASLPLTPDESLGRLASPKQGRIAILSILGVIFGILAATNSIALISFFIFQVQKPHEVTESAWLASGLSIIAILVFSSGYFWIKKYCRRLETR